MKDYVVFAGTAGQSVWCSTDRGESFGRKSAGLFMEAEVRALAHDPSSMTALYAGTDCGFYRLEWGQGTWERIITPFASPDGFRNGTLIWSMLVHPKDPNTIFLGVCPAGIYRSQDGGATWKKLSTPFTETCPPIVYTRVTTLRLDPDDPNTLWAGVEIDGLWRSPDLGESWTRVSEGMSSPDIHDFAIVPGEPRTLLATTNNDLNLSHDDGQTWQPQNVKTLFPHAYCRGLKQQEGDPSVLFLGNGNGPPGSVGSLQISKDGGSTWQQATLPQVPNSTIWTFATHPALPELLFATSINGYLYRSEDGGVTWSKSPHEFGEVRSLAILIP